MKADVLESAQQEPTFWEQLEQSFIAQVSSDASVLSSEIKLIEGRKVLNLVVTGTKSGKKFEITVYIFIDGVYTVNIVHQKRTEDASENLKNKYFISLQINK